MKKLAVLLISTALIVPANAWYPVVPVVPPAPPPPPLTAQNFPHSTGASGGLAWGAGSIIGIAAFLSGYDIARRWTCMGDPLRLGGPGFTEPNKPYENVKSPPNCGISKARRGRVLRVRG